jgi:methionyl-tRNA formyltransferase
VVKTGDGYLLLSQVQPAGKKPQSGADFVNGGRLSIGMLLTDRT